MELSSIPVAAVSLMIGVATFIFTEIDKWKRARRTDIRQWQLDTISMILSDQKAPSEFAEVRAKYLEAAQTYKEFNIPKSYKQDNEIRRALFELQSKGVVSQLSSGSYRLKREDTAAEVDEKLAKAESRVKGVMDEVVTKMSNVIAVEQQKAQAHQKENLQNLLNSLGEFQGQMAKLSEAQDHKIEMHFNEENVQKQIQKTALEMIAKRPGFYTYEDACFEIMDATKVDRVYVTIHLINLVTSGILAVDDGKLRIALHQVKIGLNPKAEAS